MNNRTGYKRPYIVPVEARLFRNGKFIGIFESYSYAARKLNCQPSHIQEVCEGKRNSHKGYIFRKYRGLLY